MVDSVLPQDATVTFLEVNFDVTDHLIKMSHQFLLAALPKIFTLKMIHIQVKMWKMQYKP